MLKFASSLLIKPVLLRDARALVGIVEDLVIEPATGKLVGILIREGFGKKNLKAVAEKDVLAIGEGFVLIPGYAVIGEVEDIVRVKSVIDQNTKIIGNKVVTVSGKHLGKVSDYTIDFPQGYLTKIFVVPGVFSLKGLSNDYIISFEQIVSIEKDKITVEDAVIGLGEKAKKSFGEPEIC